MECCGVLLQHLHQGWELRLYHPAEFASLYWCAAGSGVQL